MLLTAYRIDSTTASGYCRGNAASRAPLTSSALLTMYCLKLNRSACDFTPGRDNTSAVACTCRERYPSLPDSFASVKLQGADITACAASVVCLQLVCLHKSYLHVLDAASDCVVSDWNNRDTTAKWTRFSAHKAYVIPQASWRTRLPPHERILPMQRRSPGLTGLQKHCWPGRARSYRISCLY